MKSPLKSIKFFTWCEKAIKNAYRSGPDGMLHRDNKSTMNVEHRPLLTSTFFVKRKGHQYIQKVLIFTS